MTIHVGIDPGLDGALVALTPDGPVARLMPTLPGLSKGRVVDCWELRHWLAAVGAQVVVVEAMQGRPPGKMGGGSAMTIGANYGRILGVLVAMAYSHDIVLPQRWQKLICPGTGDPKARSVAAAIRLFPTLDLMPGKRTRPHDGIADAACLAEYARRTL